MLRRHQKFSAPGTVHFVTTATRTRCAWFVEERVCEAVLALFEGYRRKHEVLCGGYVLMPDHFHALLRQGTDADAISRLMRDFKKMTSRKCRQAYDFEPRLWSDGFDDVPVPGSHAAHTKLRYIHSNPVRAGIVTDRRMYWWSSALDYSDTRKGIVELVFLGWE